MDSSTEIDARDEEREENMEQISSDSSIGPSEQCNVFEIPTTSEVSHKSNCDSAIDSSKEASRSELPISSENWDSIDDTLNQDVDVSSELLSKIGTSNVSKKYIYGASINVIPNVPEGVTPVVGSMFQTIGECIDMYRKYADYAGFVIRRSTEHTFKDKSVRLKYLVCHRYGAPNKRSVDSMDVGEKRKVLRNSNFKVTGCKAQVRFHRVNGTSQFKLYYFHPNHNHNLLDENDRMLSRNRRQMKFSDKRLVHRATRANIGASKAHRIQVCLKGSYEEVGCSRSDYKNFKRDFDTFVGDGDVQMVVNMFNERVVNGTNFAFEFKVSEGKLQGLFWADELSRFNYSKFGHVISFDATYRSNKHCMVFVPFLAIDNNKSSVVVGSGILWDEKLPSYTWLLEAFLKVHGTQPKLVLTDQDAAIRETFPIVWNESKHRFCMWHIMNKLPNKVSTDLLVNTYFRKRLLKLVWSVYLGPQEFELKWNALMDEFNMEGHPWLSEVFSIRSKWIPGYFQDLPMCGLMKTASRSESLNSFFKSFSHHGNDLLTFILSHDSAIDKQRNRQRTDEHETNISIHNFKTLRLIERHAAMIYTKTVFFDVQKQIVKGDCYCAQWNVVIENGRQVFTIREKDEMFKTKAEFKVVQLINDGSLSCSCQHFEYFGILCCHIFNVLFNIDVDEIPMQYISRRWMRGVIPMDVLRTRRIHAGSNEQSDKLINDIQSEFDQMLNSIYADNDKLALFLEKVRSIKDEVAPNIPSIYGKVNKDAEFEKLLGVSKPTTIEIRASRGIRNKGCGTGKRLIGAGERAIKNARHKRKCRGCGELTNHDSRNCPRKKGIIE